MNSNNTFNLKIHNLTGTGYEKGWFSNCKARYRVFKGARNTKKSYDMLGLEILVKILSDSRRNVLVIRNTQNSNKTTTFNQIVKLIYQIDPRQPTLSLAPFFKINNSDLTITRKDTGQVIYFKGMDDPQKIQGIQVKFGYLTDIYVEEAFEIENYEEWRIIDGSLRESKLRPSDLKIQITFLFNAWNNKHWLYEKFFKGRLEDNFELLDNPKTAYIDYYNPEEIFDYGKGIYLHISTYKINEFRAEVYDLAMKNLKKIAPDIYKVEALGMWGNASGSTYPYMKDNLIISYEELCKIPIKSLLIGVDSGLSNGEGKIYKENDRIRSATTAVLCALSGDNSTIIALDEFYYSNSQQEVKKTPVDMAKAIVERLIYWQNQKYNNILHSPIMIYVDNADIAFRNMIELEARQLGIYVVCQPSTKIKIRTRVDFINLLMAYGEVKFFNTPNLIRELKNSQVGSEGEAREDIDDHTINAWEYAWCVFRQKVRRWGTFKEH